MRTDSAYTLPKRPQTFARILEARRTFLSGQLNEVCCENESPRILSVANGALREAESALDVCRSKGGMFVVLDGAGEPPDLFKADYPGRFMRYISYPFGAIPSPDNIGEFDYVYALNLLSELDRKPARIAVTKLISLVRPGGRLLVTNFTTEFAEAAWCASQKLRGAHYRREEEMGELVPNGREYGIAGHAVWRDDSRAVLYLEIQKAAGPNGLQQDAQAWSSS